MEIVAERIDGIDGYIEANADSVQELSAYINRIIHKNGDRPWFPFKELLVYNKAILERKVKTFSEKIKHAGADPSVDQTIYLIARSYEKRLDHYSECQVYRSSIAKEIHFNLGKEQFFVMVYRYMINHHGIPACFKGPYTAVSLKIGSRKGEEIEIEKTIDNEPWSGIYKYKDLTAIIKKYPEL